MGRSALLALCLAAFACVPAVSHGQETLFTLRGFQTGVTLEALRKTAFPDKQAKVNGLACSGDKLPVKYDLLPRNLAPKYVDVGEIQCRYYAIKTTSIGTEPETVSLLFADRMCDASFEIIRDDEGVDRVLTIACAVKADDMDDLIAIISLKYGNGSVAGAVRIWNGAADSLTLVTRGDRAIVSIQNKALRKIEDRRLEERRQRLVEFL